MKKLIQLGLRERSLVMAVTVVTLVVSLTACGNLFGFGGGSGNPGHLGASFTLPGGTISTISGDALPDGALTVHAYFVHVLTDGETEEFSDSKAHVAVDSEAVPTLEIEGTPTTEGTWDWLEGAPMTPADAC